MNYIVKLIESDEKKVSYNDEVCIELQGKKKRLYFEYNMKKFVEELGKH